MRRFEKNLQIKQYLSSLPAEIQGYHPFTDWLERNDVEKKSGNSFLLISDDPDFTFNDYFPVETIEF